MSRKSIQPVIDAFLAGTPRKVGNTETDGTSLFLFGNRIAQKALDGTISITSAGRVSKTTQDRLNGLPNVSISQKNFSWFLNGEPWDGTWRKV